MDSMKTYHIPNTDLEVSRIAFGTMHLGGSWDNKPPIQEAYDRAEVLIHTAIEQGINLIDLADIYSRGKSDKVVGHVLKNNPGLREKMILQEKMGIILADELSTGSIPHYDFSYRNITTKLETALKSLNTDYVDLLLLHRPDPLVQPDEVARAFDDLHAAGKVRHFGVSNHTPTQIELLKKSIRQPLVVNQLQLNLLHNNLISDGIIANRDASPYTGARDTLDYCRLNDILIQAWAPVASGRLFRHDPDAPANEQNTARLIDNYAQHHGTTPEAIALGWLLHHPAPIQPILGTMNPDRIVDSVKADDVQLSRLEWFSLLAAANGENIP
jgi:predicted oxidoreductase